VGYLYAHAGGHKSESNSSEVIDYFSGLDSDAAKVVKMFHTALKNGDENKLLELLAGDIVVYEAGNVERSLQQYAANHMMTDIEFLRDVKVTPLELLVKEYGNVATSFSRNKFQGIYKGSFISQENMETLILSKSEGEWKIVHIHWSN
ncbi:MAG: nuclear transport factor 2 family protein, partial [Pseudomonadota bacterium]